MAESISIRYDQTVRNCNDDIIQLKYGEDGFDPTYAVKTDLPITKYGMSLEDFKAYSSSDEEIQYWKTLVAKINFPAEQKNTTEWITAVDVRGLLRKYITQQTIEDVDLTFDSFEFSDLREIVEAMFTQVHRKTEHDISLIFQIHVYFHLRLQNTLQLSLLDVSMIVDQIQQRYEASCAVKILDNILIQKEYLPCQNRFPVKQLVDLPQVHVQHQLHRWH